MYIINVSYSTWAPPLSVGTKCISPEKYFNEILLEQRINYLKIVIIFATYHIMRAKWTYCAGTRPYWPLGRLLFKQLFCTTKISLPNNVFHKVLLFDCTHVSVKKLLITIYLQKDYLSDDDIYNQYISLKM